MQSEHQYNPPIIHPLQIYSRVFCCHCAVPNQLWLQMLLVGRVVKGFALLYQHQYLVYFSATSTPVYNIFALLYQHQCTVYLVCYINTNIQARDNTQLCQNFLLVFSTAGALASSYRNSIWVSFCRTGKMRKLCLKNIFFCPSL